MNEYKKGMLVQHSTLGLGKIVALDQKALHVFFASSQEPFATKLRLLVAQPFLSPSSSTDGWLSGLSGFAYDEKSARYRVSDPWISDADAIARFLEAFPGGFTGAKYLGDGKGSRERNLRWRRAHDEFTEVLGNGEGERLVAAGDVASLVERIRGVERHVRPLLSPAEKTALSDGLGTGEEARRFFEAVFELLAAPKPDESRFEALAAAVAALPSAEARESGWYVATLLPFVAQPDRHMLLRPKSTCDAALRLRLELDYRPTPSWSTYSDLLAAGRQLLEKLKPLGARDHVDVESFMHVAIAKHARPKAAQPAAEAK